MRYLLYIIFLSTFALHASASENNHTINVGILSFRPILENQKIWLPLGDELHKFAPQYDFNITSYPEDELIKKLAEGEFDFAIVHPSAYVALETKYGVTNIASLVRQTKDGKFHLTSYGGVIASLSTNKNIYTLQDVAGKTIATTHKDGFAVMLAQREVFHNVGIDITKDCEMLYTEQPMDRVVESLRKNKADVGFFRTGYIEEMIENGKLKPDELRIINKIENDNYPYAHSTPLYPEWAVLATQKPNIQIIKAVIAALYQIHSDTSLAYHEFSTALSYKSTRELMQKYHVYPFENTQMSLQEIINTYAFGIVLLLLFLTFGGIVMAILYRYQMLYIKKQAKQIEIILATASDGIHVHDLDGKLFLFSDSFASMLGYSREDISKLTIYDWDHNFDPTKIYTMMREVVEHPAIFETKHTRKDGTIFDVEIFSKGIVIGNKNYIYASARDITERKNNEIKLLKHKTIFDNLAEGVYAVDTYNRCTYINNAGLTLLQLTEDEILGKNPHAIFHYINHIDICPIQMAVISGIPTNLEEQFVQKDGSIFPVFITISPIIKDGISLGSVITFIDISKQQADQNKLILEKERFEHLAHYDTLTNLPNRLSLIEYMEMQYLEQSSFAFMLLDLDGFKEINDSYGHQFGDKLLVMVAILLQKIFSQEAFIVRTGGDEFVILVECNNQKDIINTYMNNLIDMFNHPFNIDEIDVYVTASVGIAMYPNDSKTHEGLMQQADAAMYNAKKWVKIHLAFIPLL